MERADSDHTCPPEAHQGDAVSLSPHCPKVLYVLPGKQRNIALVNMKPRVPTVIIAITLTFAENLAAQAGATEQAVKTGFGELNYEAAYPM